MSDISANADFDMIICDKGKCKGGWGGTSFSSPIWAGFTALMNQYAAQQGKPTVGFLNPTLYTSVQEQHEDVARHRRQFRAASIRP